MDSSSCEEIDIIDSQPSPQPSSPIFLFGFVSNIILQYISTTYQWICSLINLGGRFARNILVYVDYGKRLIKWGREKKTATVYVVSGFETCEKIMRENLARYPQAYNFVGMDCEWVSQPGCSNNPVALLQLATPNNECFLIRLAKMNAHRLPQTLKAILEDKRVLKFGVGIMDDARKLANQYGVDICGCVDLRHLVLRCRWAIEKEAISDERGCQRIQKMGLHSLAERIIGVKMDKHWKIRCSNWEAEELSVRQVEYAANDALVAIHVFLQLVNLKDKEITARGEFNYSSSKNDVSQFSSEGSSEETNKPLCENSFMGEKDGTCVDDKEDPRVDAKDDTCVDGKDDLCVDGKDDFCVDGKDDLCVDGKDDFCVDGKDDFCVDEKDDFCVDGKDDLCVDGKDDFCVDGKDDFCVDGKDDLCVDEKDDFCVDGKDDFCVDEKDDTCVDGKDDFCVDEKDDTCVDGKDDTCVDGKDDFCVDEKDDTCVDGKDDTCVDGKDDTCVDGKDDFCVDEKDDTCVDGKDDTCVDGKDDTCVDGKDDFCVDEKVDTCVDGKDDTCVDGKDDTCVDGKDDTCVDEKDDTCVDGKDDTCVDGKDDTCVDGKDDTCVDGKDDFCVDRKDGTSVDGKDNFCVDEKDDTSVDGKDDFCVDEKDDFCVDEDDYCVDENDDTFVDGKDYFYVDEKDDFCVDEKDDTCVEEVDATNLQSKEIATSVVAASQFVYRSRDIPGGNTTGADNSDVHTGDFLLDRTKKISVDPTVMTMDLNKLEIESKQNVGYLTKTNDLISDSLFCKRAISLCQGLVDQGFKQKCNKKTKAVKEVGKDVAVLPKKVRYIVQVKKKLPYSRCVLQAPDCSRLCTLGRKKADWYLVNKLGELIAEDPYTVRLKFEPAGRPKSKEDYYLTFKENVCVVCGKSDTFLSKSIVPRDYRQHFPSCLKDHHSHDILVMCPQCHRRASDYDLMFRRELAEEYGAPIGNQANGAVARLVIDQKLKKVQFAAKAIVYSGGKLPQKRKKELLRIVEEFYGESDVSEDMLQSAATMSIKKLNCDYKSHGEEVVKKVLARGKLLEFEKAWRQRFLDTMSPQYLPPFWSVDHRHEEIREKLV